MMQSFVRRMITLFFASAALAATCRADNLLLLGGRMDPEYAKFLQEQGYRIVERSYKAKAVTVEQLKRFNVVLLGAIPDTYGGELYEPDGIKLLETRKTLAAINAYVLQGGGAFFISQTAGAGQATALAMSRALKPWGLRVLGEQVRDAAHQVGNHSWTETVIRHAVTQGIQRIYYPVHLLRWDDAYATNPLILLDKAWKPIVRGGPSSFAARNIQGSYSDEGWVAGEGGKAPVIVAVREMPQGRVAATGIGAEFLLWNVSSKTEWIGENRTGPIDWIALQKGDGKVSSDLGRLMLNIFRWLAEPGRRKSFGGDLPTFEQDTPEEVASVPAWTKVNWDMVELPPTWSHTAMIHNYNGVYYYPEVPDPLVEGPVQYYKALIGAHTSYSDGIGTVAQFTKAARDAGYTCIVFTESFEHLTKEEWKKLLTECEAASDDNFVALAGIDIADQYGNRFIVFGQVTYPPPQALTKDGRAMEKTQFFSLGFSDHMVAVHRASSTPLPAELHKHFFGWVVYTYRNGNMIDNSFPGYQWQVAASSNPCPLVVHEVFSPEDVVKESKVGYQQIIPGSSATQATHYFRNGLPHYFANPPRYFLSEGPVIDVWSIINKDEGRVEDNRDHWRLGLGATSDEPITEVLLFDGYSLSRRWTPKAKQFRTTVDGWHAAAHFFILVAQDAKGRCALSPGIRTVPHGYLVRCGDRQNWFGSGSLGYTGTLIPGYDIRIPTFGTNEASRLWGSQFGPVRGENMAPIKNFPFVSNAMTVNEYQVDQRYIRALWDEVVFDAKPSHATARSRVYAAKVRLFDFHAGPTLEQVRVHLRRPVHIRDFVCPILTSEDIKLGIVLNASGSSEGQKVEMAGKPYLDLPPGSQVGSLIILSAGLRVNTRGEIGFAANPLAEHTLPADTAWTAEFVRLNPKQPITDARKRMGFAGPTPYQLHLRRGRLDHIGYVAHLEANHYGVAGDIAAAKIGYDLPLAIRGINPHWDAAVWLPGSPLVFFGVFERTGWAKLDVSREGAFFAGNVIRCGNPQLRLAIIRWDKETIRFEAHNPTDASIETTVETPEEIADRFRLNANITVPPATTQILTFPRQ